MGAATGRAVFGAMMAGAVALGASTVAAAPTEPPLARTEAPWRSGPPRWFLASKIDVGFLYLRPRLSGGFGIPHDVWAGVDMNPIVSGSQVGGYAGLRVETPMVELRSGVATSYSFWRTTFPLRSRYRRQDIDLRDGSRAFPVSWDTELTLNLPLGPGVLHSETNPVLVGNVPADRRVFLPTLQVVMRGDARWAFRQRLGYFFHVPGIEDLSVGALAEPIAVPERGILVWRAGVSSRWKLFDDIEIRTNFIPVVYSRDRLGLIAADVGEVGLRWTWATGP